MKFWTIRESFRTTNFYHCTLMRTSTSNMCTVRKRANMSLSTLWKVGDFLFYLRLPDDSGHDVAYVRLQKQKETGSNLTVDYDEIAKDFRVRYMTSMEAFLRLWGYPVAHLSHSVCHWYYRAFFPNWAFQVYSLSSRLPGTEGRVFLEGCEEQAIHEAMEEGDDDHTQSRLQAFFNLCSEDANARQYTYENVCEACL